MLRRLAVLVPAALAVSFVTCLPARAADVVIICVAHPGGSCDEPVDTLGEAAMLANANGQDNVVRIAATTLNETGPVVFNDTGHSLTIQGAGEGQTILTLPESAIAQTYLSVEHGSVSGLTISMVGTGDVSSNDHGLDVSHAMVDHVTIAGQGTTNTQGLIASSSTISHLTVSLDQDANPSTRGALLGGDNTISDSSLTATSGVVQSAPDLDHSDDDDHGDSLSRVRVHAQADGVTTDGGTVDVDDSLVVIAPGSGRGLHTENSNNGAFEMTIKANHVTVVGGGGLSSVGVLARSVSPIAVQWSTIKLDNSIVWGFGTDVKAEASNDGTPADTSRAIVTSTFSDYATHAAPPGNNASVSVPDPLLSVDPKFVDTVDYRLKAGSPLIDRGSSLPPGPATDLDGNQRVSASFAGGNAVRDMGAYEFQRPTGPGIPGTPSGPSGPTADTTAPQTTIVKAPKKPSPKPKVTFVFAASEAGATFESQLDGKGWKACSAKLTLKVKVGKHKLLVRATDAAGNVDPTPAKSKKFTRTK